MVNKRKVLGIVLGVLIIMMIGDTSAKLIKDFQSSTRSVEQAIMAANASVQTKEPLTDEKSEAEVENTAEVEKTTKTETTTKVEMTTEVETTVKVETTTKAEKTTEVETTTKVEKTTEVESTTKWCGTKLNSVNGAVIGPSGKETFYNLKMSGVIKKMRNMGYSEEEFPYHVREDGVKMLGPYIMCAADLKLRPRGTIIETSLGTAMVCDTGDFALYNKTQLDIAVTW